MNRQAGMTLVEVLTAMAVLAILAVLAARGLGAVADGQQRIEAERRHWDEVAAFFARFGDGVAQALPGPDWRADGSVLAYQRLAAAGTTREAWRLHQGRVELAQGQPPAWLPALGGVRGLAWRFLAADGQWQATWPAADRLPRAVALTVELDDGNRLDRLFATP